MRFRKCFFIILLVLVTSSEGRRGGHGHSSSSSSRGGGGGGGGTAPWPWYAIALMTIAAGLMFFLCCYTCSKCLQESDDQNKGEMNLTNVEQTFGETSNSMVYSPQESNIQQMAVGEPVQNNPLPYPLHPQGPDAPQQTTGDHNNPPSYPLDCPPAYESQGHSDGTPAIPPPAYQSF